MRSWRAATIAVLAAMPIVSIPIAVPAPAYAADELGVSVDGVTWSGSLDEPLFTTPSLWVPGDSETRSFFVRNQAADAGELEVTVVADESWLLADGDIAIDARVGGGAWAPVDEGTQTLLSDELAAGADARIDVRVSADWAQQNRTQTTTLPLDIVVTLTDADASAGPAPGPSTTGPSTTAPSTPDGDDDLAATGAMIRYGLLWAGALLAGGGLALIALRRRDGDAREAPRG